MAKAGQILVLNKDGTSSTSISSWNDGFGEGKVAGGVGCETQLNEIVDYNSRTFVKVAWGGVSSINVSEAGEVTIEGGVHGGSRKLKTSPEYAPRLAAAFNFLREACKPVLGGTGF